MNRHGATEMGAERLLTAQEAADHLRIGRRHLWTITDKGDLPRIKIGRAVRYRMADLETYVGNCRTKLGGD